MSDIVRFDWFIVRMLRDKKIDDGVFEGFLSALLKKDIKVLGLLESREDRAEYNRVALLAEEEEGKKIIVYIVNLRESDYLEQILYGPPKIRVDDFPLAAEHKSIARVISVSIIFFNVRTGNDYLYYGEQELYGMNTREKLNMRYKMEIRYQEKPEIIPEYYSIHVESFSERVGQVIDEWIYMLKNLTIKKDFNSKGIKEAQEKMNR